jgi:hypothetical protein
MADRAGRARAVTLLLLLAAARLAADGVAIPSPAATRPGAIFSLEPFVRHRRAARLTTAVGMLAGFACVALSVVGITTDCAAFVAEAAPASAVRRDVILFCASAALLSLSAAAFDALAPPADAPAP